MTPFPKIAFVALLLLVTLTARAEIQTVTLLTDDGDEECDATCTLRDAILAAAISPGPSEIQFQPGLTGTITLTSKLSFFGDDTTINGPGPDRIAISGDDQFIAMEIPSANDNGTVRGLTIRDGFNDAGAGAGLIAHGKNMLLENLRIIDNHNSSQAAGVYMGGGGTMRNCEISGNSGTLISGLLINGIRPVLIENVTISGNTATQQTSTLGVLTNAGQDVILRYLTVANNAGGGQLAVNISNSGGSTTVEASIFTDNATSNADLSVSADTPVNNSIIGAVNGSITLGANNLVGVDPALLPLGFVSGSSTQVHRFTQDSVAFDHVESGTGDPQCGTGVTSDQVGNPRPGGALCDAGAYEVRPGVLIDDGFE